MKTDDASTAVLDGFRRRLEADSDVVIADGERIVARFTGRAGILRYATVELVSFRADGIAFEHLTGPFRKCHERFEVTPSPGGGSSMTHEGAFTMRAGLFGWLLGISLARRSFEQHAATHMAHHLSDHT